MLAKVTYCMYLTENKAKKVIITNALPYANGELHLGHLYSYISSDIRARYLRSKKRDVLHVCGSDMHGTPIMLAAMKHNESPADRSCLYADLHREAFSLFQVRFDVYQSTNHEDNSSLVNDIFDQLFKKKAISLSDSTELFDEEAQMFLPERLKYAVCSTCNSKIENAYCVACNSQQIQYRSSLSNTEPIQKVVPQYYLSINLVADQLKEWHKSLDKDCSSIMDEWSISGLRDFSISRCPPYHGVKIKNDHEEIGERYFYVWFDAPIGYLATIQSLYPQEWRSVWNNSIIEQFIGKDILSFHTIFWPAVLTYCDLKKPDGLFINGHLLANKTKLSKSSGHVISALEFGKNIEPDLFRYYVASKLCKKKDVSLSTSDFLTVVNSHLIGKVLNIVNRLQGMLKKHDNVLLGTIKSHDLRTTIENANEQINSFYEKHEISRVISTVEEVAIHCNVFINMNEPWKLKAQEQHRVVSDGLQCFYSLMYWLRPIIPNISAKSALYFGSKYENGIYIKDNVVVNRYQTLVHTVEESSIKEFLTV